MNMENKKRLGLALCGSYCTYEKLFAVLGTLRDWRNNMNWCQL